jgi:hypothetical protein
VDSLQADIKIGFHGAHIGPNGRTWQDAAYADHFRCGKVL